jgi:hypothetical protein
VIAPVQVAATPAVPRAPMAVVPRAKATVVTHALAPLPVVSGAVRQGSFCARDAVGQSGYTSAGTEMTCSYNADELESQPRWRASGGPVIAPTTIAPTTRAPTISSTSTKTRSDAAPAS